MKEYRGCPILTNELQYGVFHSIGTFYHYDALYAAMCVWYERTIEIQQINRETYDSNRTQ